MSSGNWQDYRKLNSALPYRMSSGTLCTVQAKQGSSMYREKATGDEWIVVPTEGHFVRLTRTNADGEKVFRDVSPSTLHSEYEYLFNRGGEIGTL